MPDLHSGARRAVLQGLGQARHKETKMALYEFEGKRPSVGEDTYISDTADVIGDVTIGSRCYIGPGARIKGDYGTVRIGDQTSVQENCVIHARPAEICAIGDNVTVRHGAILHNCTVEDGAILGMGSITSDWAVIGENALVAEGCVVRQHQKVPPGKVAAGVPARIRGDVPEGTKKDWQLYKTVYIDLAKRYPKGLKKIT